MMLPEDDDVSIKGEGGWTKSKMGHIFGRLFRGCQQGSVGIVIAGPTALSWRDGLKTAARGLLSFLPLCMCMFLYIAR
jgi:hypothetical protein